MLTSDQIGRIVTTYGHRPLKVFAPQSGYRNLSYRVDLPGDRTANLIIYKAEPGMLRRIRNANSLGNYLAAQGLPTRSPLDPRIIRLTNHPARYAALYHYLPGSTIPWEAYTMEHIKALGSTMAQLHTTLHNMPQAVASSEGRAPNLPLVTDEYLAIIRRMRRYFTDPGVNMAINQKMGNIPIFRLARYAQVLQISRQLAQQPLHMDFVRGNILFSHDATITGILDFEKASLGHPVFDLARTLAFLLVDCKFKTEPQIRKYFLCSGYHKRGGGVLPNAKLLDELVDLFLLYDFYKFLRHNPYEFLSQNEHFVRTKILLEQRSLLLSLTPRVHPNYLRPR